MICEIHVGTSRHVAYVLGDGAVFVDVLREQPPARREDLEELACGQ